MKRNVSIAIALLVFLNAGSLFAKAVTFRNAGVKDKTVVVLDVSGKTASGTFSSRPYDEEGASVPFTGKVVATFVSEVELEPASEE